jgi:hypothetical protein
MGAYTERVAGALAGTLVPGEQVVEATPGAPRGSMRALAFGGGRGGKAELRAGRAELDVFGVGPQRQYVVVLTDRRFLFARTSVLGRPKAVVADVPRGEIAELRLGQGRALGQRYGELRFRRTDGRQCTLEVAGQYVGHAYDVVSAFNGVTAG